MERPHKRLDAWKLAVDLAILVYHATEGFPKEERFGLVNQIRRAAVGIPANIAEGAARKSKKEFVQYLHVARGSVSELDTHLEIARRLGFIEEALWKELNGQIERADMLLAGLLRSQKSCRL